MKRKLFSLLALALLTALLLVGCDHAGENESTSSETTTTTPEIIYRPDLAWSLSGEKIAMTLVLPQAGTFFIRFEPSDELLSNEATKYAIQFEFYDVDENAEMKLTYDEESLIAYMADQGIEEVGEAGGYDEPVFAVTWAQLNELDCVAIQDAMGISHEYGLDVWLAKGITE